MGKGRDKGERRMGGQEGGRVRGGQCDTCGSVSYYKEFNNHWYEELIEFT